MSLVGWSPISDTLLETCRLLAPAEEYGAIFTTVCVRLQLASLGGVLVSQEPDVGYEKAVGVMCAAPAADALQLPGEEPDEYAGNRPSRLREQDIQVGSFSFLAVWLEMDVF